MTRHTTERRHKALLARAQRVIRVRYAEFDLGLRDVAEDAGCSSRQLQRVFLEFGGQDFRNYLLQVRMERALKLLSRERNPLTIRATALRVGYRQASGLRPAFKRHFGITPSAVQPEPPHYLGDQIISRGSLSMEREE